MCPSYLSLMNPSLWEIPRDAKKGRFVAAEMEAAMPKFYPCGCPIIVSDDQKKPEAKHYPGGYSILDTGSPKRPWKVRSGYDKTRERIGFASEQEAINYVTLEYQARLDKNKPLLNLRPDDEERWTILRTVAAKLENASPQQLAEWNCIVHVSDKTRTTLYMMAPRIEHCGDRHKPAYMAKGLFDKLESTRSNFTVLQMVENRLNLKADKNGRLPEREKERAKGHFQQTFEVGQAVIDFFRPHTDIDSITREGIKSWKIWYINELHSDEKGNPTIGRNTMENNRMGILASFFIEAGRMGWPGTPPCKAVNVGTDHGRLILNFREAVGIMIALRYRSSRPASFQPLANRWPPTDTETRCWLGRPTGSHPVANLGPGPGRKEPIPGYSFPGCARL